MSERSVIEHALTVYFDGDAELAGKAIDNYRDFVAHELAEKIRNRDYADYDDATAEDAADPIDPEVADG